MAIKRYLAMTAAEIQSSDPLPPNIAWMACHFSPYTTGLSNRPRELPPNSLLILNDVTPIHGHDPDLVASQLLELVEGLGCMGVLLDFQRAGYPDTVDLARALIDTLPCPVAVSELYAEELGCPIFLPPGPLHQSLAEYLGPWQGREVWLEMALDSEIITLTESGAAISPLAADSSLEGGHREEALHCHYRIELEENTARFTLWRTREDLEGLMEEAEALGIKTAVGLYQEIG